MIRQTLSPIVKRSIHCRRCMFQNPRNGSKLLPRERQPLFRPTVTSPLRVSSTASPFANAIAGSAGTMLQRSMPVFSQDAIQKALPLIGNGAYMALMSGFLMTDMLQLRLMLVGGYAGLVTFHSLHARPLQIPLRWSALFVVVNAGAAMLLFVDQWIGVLLSEDEMALYEKHFRDGLTPGQFYYLLKLAKTTEIEDGSTLTNEGCVSPNLYFIEKGQAKVYHRGTFASYVDEGGFVNDVAFQRMKESNSSNNHDRIGSSSDSKNEIGDNGAIHQNDGNEKRSPGVGAYGTVIANGDCKVWVWDRAELKDYLSKHPDMDRSMKYALSQHLVRSLLKQREVRRRATRAEQGILQKIELTMPGRREFRRIKTSNWP